MSTSPDEQSGRRPWYGQENEPTAPQPTHEARHGASDPRDPRFRAEGASAEQGAYAGRAGYDQQGTYDQGGYGQHSGRQYGEDPYGQGRPVRERRRGRPGMFVAGVAVAALVGGVVGGGAVALTGSGSTTDSAGTTTHSQTIVNNTDSVNEVTAAAQKASPSVVTIAATASSESGTGSGIILDDQGHILTNTHVVTLDGATGSAKLEVQLSDGKARSATVVGTDPTSDLAVIKIDPKGLSLTPATLGESGKTNVGDTAIAIGSPLGLSGTVTDGIVSSLNRTISVASSAAPESDSSESDGGSDSGSSSSGRSPFQFQFPDQNGETKQSQSSTQIALRVMQTDAAINPGNSGGALVNSKGEVIGVNVAIASAGSSSSDSGGSGSSSSSSGNIGVGFSIPIDYAKRISQQIIDSGKATHGFLGASVSSSPADGDSSQSFSDGAVVKSVTSGGPAANAGLKAGDVVTELNGQAVTDAESLTAVVREGKPGDTEQAKILRNGSEKTVSITLGDSSQSSSSSSR